MNTQELKQRTKEFAQQCVKIDLQNKTRQAIK